MDSNDSNKRKKKNVVKEYVPKKKNTSKKLDVTTKIRIDRARINDSESLDTSFLEGRLQKKAQNNKKAREKILKEKKDYSEQFAFFKIIFYFLAVLCLMILIFLICQNRSLPRSTEPSNTTSVSEETGEKKVDDNYLLVGDFHMEGFVLEDYQLDYRYIKVSADDMSISKILENMKTNIYQYNPSVIFLELGMVDLKDGVSEDEIIQTYMNLISEIRENRPYAAIYVQSLYPINEDIDGYDKNLMKNVSYKKIKSLNKRLKEMSASLYVPFLDVFVELNDNGKLKEEYTDDGISLNQTGYGRLSKIFRKIVDDNG